MVFFNSIEAILEMTSGLKFKTERIIGKKKINQGAICNAIFVVI